MSLVKKAAKNHRSNPGVKALIEHLETRVMLAATPFRPPAVPLVASDPYLSVWSESDTLNGSQTVHWTGTENALVSLLRVDGTTWRLMGTDPATAPALPQVGLQVLPTRSIYDFDNGSIHVTLTFMTPALPSNLDVLTRPLTYITWDVHSVDGKKHSVQIYDSTSSELAVNTNDQQVTWGRGSAGNLTALHVGTTAQTIFSPAGDGVRIDWGYAYTAAQASLSKQAVGADATLINNFVSQGTFFSIDDKNIPRAVNTNQPVMAFTFQLGSVGSGVVSRHVIVGYDELYSVNYFGRSLVPYWKRNGQTMPQLLATAETQYTSLVQQCKAFDTQLMTDLTTAGGPQYAQLTALAYRQALAGNGIAADANKQPLLFSKENTSNGDIATADIIFPEDPIFLLLNPTLAKASMVPLLQYAGSPAWTQPYAPHDLGTYPVAQNPSGEQQPVEESANMLILAAAIAKQENSAEFASAFWPQLTQWAQYLKPYAVDPGNQLTTDDFLGTIQSSSNLAVKAIEGLGAYSQLLKLRGDTANATAYSNLAKADVTHWMSAANDGNHYRLGYNLPNSWSQLYNLVWDKILGLNLFPASVAAEEIAYYKTILQPYGLPVESTTNIAKTDWSVWTATLSSNLSDFETLVAPIYNFMNTTGNRQPLQDEYATNNINSGGFHARPVVGGLFIKMLADPTLWAKYSSQDHTVLTGWAPLPNITPVLPDALTAAQTWKFTTATPTSSWTSTTFNDNTWSQGLGGFGTAGTPGAIVNTTWNSADIYLRKNFTMPTGTFSQLKIQAYHDEDLQVYINGTLAVSAPGFATGYQTFGISPAALAKLTPGAAVTIAVHCHQTVGGQDIDVGLVNIS